MKISNIKKRRLFIVSNRLPVSIKEENGRYEFQQSVGGLATGLTNLLEKVKGYWIGWPGIVDVSRRKRNIIVNGLKKKHGCIPVFLSGDEMEKYYNGFSNSTIWPLFHYQSMHSTYNESEWEAYKRVNEKFAKKVLEVAGKNDIIWVHDYHLLLLPGLIRKALPKATIGYFLHIPFPSQELFRLLPWRQQLLEGMLGADQIGFHTYDYTRHFLSCCVRLANHENEFGEMHINNRAVWADTFPMGIDVQKFYNFKSNKKKLPVFVKDLPNKKIILSVDRMDISKGIPKRLVAFERFLEKYPQWVGKVVYILICSPSRTHILNYQILKKNVDELVGKINGKFSTLNWTPIQYIYQSVSQDDLTYLYRRSHVALITPLRDGMNLVAKEYIASRSDYKGVLILGEGAGAVNELGEAIIINPNDVEQTADAIHEGLKMPPDEQSKRMRRMITRLRRYDIFRWGEDFVENLVQRGEKREKTNNIPLTKNIIKDIASSYKKAKNRVLFLDYDGTLISSKKTKVIKPNPEIISLLKKLSGVRSNRVVLVSRRQKYRLKKWFESCRGLDMIAEHGLWLYKHKVKKWMPFETKVRIEWKDRIRPIFETYVDRTPGAFIEEKPHSLSWDYQDSDPELAEMRIRELMINLLSIVAGKPLEILRGNRVVGVKLNAISKGKAANRILEEEKDVDFMMAIGDDWTDEEMFSALPESCVTIKVKYAEKSKAKYFAESHKEILSLLKQLV